MVWAGVTSTIDAIRSGMWAHVRHQILQLNSAIYVGPVDLHIVFVCLLFKQIEMQKIDWNFKCEIWLHFILIVFFFLN